MRARQRALTPRDIKRGWQATGLEPLSPIVVLDKLESAQRSVASCPRTPAHPSSLDLSLLHSSPPDGTELRRANMVLHDELAKINEFISPVKRYMQRMTKAFEVTQSELITARKQLSESQSLLQTRKARKRGKRVALKIASCKSSFKARIFI